VEIYQLAQQEVNVLHQRMHQLQLQAQLAAAAPAVAAPAAAPALDANAIATAIGRAVAAASTLQPLPLFDGAGNASGIAAYSWLQQVELAFEARTRAIGVSVGDAECVSSAGSALRAGAQAWYSSLATRPTTWVAFKESLLSRFQPASSRRLIESRLEALVENISKTRDRLNTQGLEKYTQQFQLLANQIPADMMIERAKVLLYAKGLPLRLREFALGEEDKAYGTASPLQLNAIVDKILKRSATRDTALGGTASSNSHDAMDVSAVELCSQAFEISAAEAADYLEGGEGWAAHDTSSSAPQGRHSTSTSSLEQQVNALQLQLAAMGRRSVAPPVRNDVPKELAEARKAAGLCIRCGVTKYEAGGKGHNSRTCKLPMDKSTSAAAGAKRAGLSAPLFQ
jgi:hypothetical protein